MTLYNATYVCHARQEGQSEAGQAAGGAASPTPQQQQAEEESTDDPSKGFSFTTGPDDNEVGMRRGRGGG